MFLIFDLVITKWTHGRSWIVSVTIHVVVDGQHTKPYLTQSNSKIINTNVLNPNLPVIEDFVHR